MEREEIKLSFNKDRYKINLEEEKDVCIKESEDVGLKHRLNCLMNMPMLGAASIIEIKAIQNRLDELSEEKDYSKWFRNNEPIIEDLFQSMKIHYLTIGEIYELAYDDENHLKFKNYNLHRDFLLKLLKRYGYIVEDKLWNGKKIKMVIRYKERSN